MILLYKIDGVNRRKQNRVIDVHDISIELDTKIELFILDYFFLGKNNKENGVTP